MSSHRYFFLKKLKKKIRSQAPGGHRSLAPDFDTSNKTSRRGFTIIEMMIVLMSAHVGQHRNAGREEIYLDAGEYL